VVNFLYKASVPPLSNKKPIDDGWKSDCPEWLTDNPNYFYPTKYPPSYYNAKPWTTTTTPNSESSGLPFSLKPYKDMFNPSPFMPISRVTRDPWWHEAGLKPMDHIPHDVLVYPSALRNSYLSPVKNNYLWSNHPLRYL